METGIKTETMVDNCSVCLDPVLGDTTINSKIFSCDCNLSTFHSKCLQKWLNHDFSCPLCREDEEELGERIEEEREVEERVEERNEARRRLIEILNTINRDLNRRRQSDFEVRIRTRGGGYTVIWKRIVLSSIFLFLFIMTGRIIFLSFILILLFPTTFLIL